MKKPSSTYVVPSDVLLQNFGFTYGEPLPLPLAHAFAERLLNRTAQDFVAVLRGRDMWEDVVVSEVSLSPALSPERRDALYIQLSYPSGGSHGEPAVLTLTELEVRRNCLSVVAPKTGERSVTFSSDENGMEAAAWLAEHLALRPNRLVFQGHEDLRKLLTNGLVELGVITDGMSKEASGAAVPEEEEMVFKLRMEGLVEPRSEKFSVPLVLLPNQKGNFAEFWILRVKYGKSGTVTVRLRPASALDLCDLGEGRKTAHISSSTRGFVSDVMNALTLHAR